MEQGEEACCHGKQMTLLPPVSSRSPQDDYHPQQGQGECIFTSGKVEVSIWQWAGPLDLYGKEDTPALHESPSYG